jgi:hypothetical protein
MLKAEVSRGSGWIQTYTGKAFWPLDPRPEELDIEDIAHALSHQCRYAGHTSAFYSVAEHSVHISYAVSPENALWGLLHDASEAYLVDIPRPLKPFMPDYKVWEARLMQCIAQRFGLTGEEPVEVKEMDTRILHNERKALMRTGLEWSLKGEPIPNLVIVGWEPAAAYSEFMIRFIDLYRGLKGEVE